jgi:hypothetical protein
MITIPPLTATRQQISNINTVLIQTIILVLCTPKLNGKTPAMPLQAS